MPTPKPWSFSSLDSFLTCPRKYYFTSVEKKYVEAPGEQQLYGTRVHQDFENYIKDGVALPPDLQDHALYMAKLRNRPGEILAERKVALNIRFQPTGYFDKDVWWRGVVDYTNKDGTTHRIVDYKTGKMRVKPLQLHMNMLYAFAEGAEVCEAEFYWTQTKVTTPMVFPKFHGQAIVKTLKPMIAEYAEAWHKDIWQPRPSGLCKGWCPVTECEFHGRGK